MTTPYHAIKIDLNMHDLCVLTGHIHHAIETSTNIDAFKVLEKFTDEFGYTKSLEKSRLVQYLLQELRGPADADNPIAPNDYRALPDLQLRRLNGMSSDIIANEMAAWLNHGQEHGFHVSSQNGTIFNLCSSVWHQKGTTFFDAVDKIVKERNIQASYQMVMDNMGITLGKKGIDALPAELANKVSILARKTTESGKYALQPPL